MCGFSGIISKRDFNADSIEASLRSIKHRGPDNTLITDTRTIFSSKLSNNNTQDTFPSPNNSTSNIWLGFNRLSIVDYSEKAMQPFYDEKSKHYFMLNGEIYNYKSLRKEHLEDTPFVSESDSEVAFKMYLKYGDAFVDYLQGMFAIVIYDQTSRQLKIWRDRLGIKPFYYSQTEDGFIFSSEITGILSTKIVNKKPNFTGIAYSMYLGTCPSPLTIYEDIHSLEPGHSMVYSLEDKTISKSNYWHLKYTPNKEEISAKEFDQDLRQLCELYYTGEASKGLMLSGGIDSGTLAYYYGRLDKKLVALTLYQENSRNNELEYTRDNAQNAGLQLEEYHLNPLDDPIKEKYYLNAEEEPNTTPEPAIFISKKARERGLRVLYNALGPDEIFGGYEYFQRIEKFNKYKLLIKLIPSYILPQEKRSKFKALKKYGIENFAFISRSIFTWEEICQILSRNNQSIPLHPILFINQQIEGIYKGFKSLPLLKKASYLDIFYYIASHHTFRGDRPSMIQSIEMRFPFLEHTFIEKYFNQPSVFENLQKELKPQMRKYVRPILSKKVRNMPKKGFTIDTSIWKEKNNTQRDWYMKGLLEIFDDIIIK